MKVADDNVGGFEHGLEQGTGRDDAPGRLHDREMEHDVRGLVVAILLCMVCWAALGYFLLA